MKHGERNRQLRPTDMRMQGQGVRGRYGRGGRKSDLVEQEIQGSKVRR